MYTSLSVYTVERKKEEIENIKENIRRFALYNIIPLFGKATDHLDSLPAPDSVFIGGSGGKLWEILETVDQRLATDGRIVLNAITLDTLTSANEFFGNAGYAVEVVTVSGRVARSAHSMA